MVEPPAMTGGNYFYDPERKEFRQRRVEPASGADAVPESEAEPAAPEAAPEEPEPSPPPVQYVNPVPRRRKSQKRRQTRRIAAWIFIGGLVIAWGLLLLLHFMPGLIEPDPSGPDATPAENAARVEQLLDDIQRDRN